MTRSRSKREVLEEYRMSSIREAASRVIARKGLGKATMQEIADEAGIAKGTLYLYFRDRDELLERSVDHVLDQLRTTVEEMLDRDLPFATLFEELIRAELEFFDRNDELFRVYLATCESSHRRKKHRDQHPRYRRYIATVTKLFTAAMDRGELRRVDAESLAAFVTEGVNAIIVRRLRSSAKPSIEADVDLIVSTMLVGLATERNPS